ncbi:M50 family metallopeptidase [Bacillus thermotolerans]|uniref:M50 family metallopeptidase n=1 Tax=Bacillus thermotolerans TaxID=1221996 RepID=UPI0005922E2C|nr:M50 family metallopeptidase [Bacillus thermotolerans]KKB43468.1 Stage IV sporulation pro-sigma-K processing enzyme (SpoIVFB) [Bacillus thermotolerans]
MTSLMRKVHIHPLMWIVVAVCLLTGFFLHLLLVFLIIAIHEFGHVLAAKFFDWRIRKISFLPFGGVAEMDEHGNRPIKEEVFVVLAGPLQHVWLFAVAWLLSLAGWVPDHLYTLFFELNAAILLFNLLPVYPLDGGKILLLLLSWRKPYLFAFRWAILCSGFLLILLQAIVFLFFPFHLQAWALFAYLAWSLWRTWKEKRYAFMRFLLERHYGNKGEAASLKPLPALAGEPVLDVLERFQRNAKHIIYVTGERQFRLDENELLYAYFAEKRTNARLGDLLPID